MPHRDDREALNAKLEAQGRELAEAKEENERLRAANLRKATEIERMRVQSAEQDAVDGADHEVANAGADAELPPSADAPPGLHAMHHPNGHQPNGHLPLHLRRQLGGLLIASSVLVGGLSLSAVHLAGTGARCHGGCPLAAAPGAVASLHATFAATISESSGATAHANGESCVIDATLEGDPASQVQSVSALTIACNGETVYAPVAGALRGVGAIWNGETPGRARYELRASDSASAVHLDLHSWDGRARLEGADWVIDLSVAAFSAETEVPFAVPAAAEAVVVRTGHVTDASGLAVGTPCDVARRPVTEGAYSHRVVVRCGGHTLYGAGDTGFVYPSRDPRVSLDEDSSGDDGDARMTLDLVQGEAHLEDGLGLVAQHVDIALDPG